MQFKKKPIRLVVEFATQAGTIQTLEGIVSYEANDAIVTGTHNERWPIKRENFESTYSPVKPLHMGQDGDYFKKPILVNAAQILVEAKVTINMGNDSLTAKPGDWIVTDDSGKQWVVDNAIFLDTYEPIF